MNMYQKIADIAKLHPHEIALSCNNKHMSYESLFEHIEIATYKCLHANIKPNDKVALLLPNIFECVILLYALNQLGCTVVMLHPLSSPAMIQKRCELVGVSKVFVLDALAHRYTSILSKKSTIVISMANTLNGFEKVFLKAKYAFKFRKNKFDKLKSTPTGYIPSNNKDAVILFSSGTTGEQKAISLSSEAFNALADQMKQQVTPEVGIDSMYCVLPFFHGFGLGVSLHGVLAIGGRCVLVPRLKKKTMVNELLKERPTYITGVPYLYRILLNDKTFASSDLSFIKEAFVGGELVAPQLIEKFNALLKEKKAKGSLRIGYGMSEATTAITISEPFDSTPHCVGYPLDGNTIKIIKEDNNEAEVFEHGEICVAGPVLMNGYYNNPKLTKQVFSKREGVLYYHSSDIGYKDEKGRIYFSHRSDELIKVKGYFVNPLEVEEQLYKVKGCMEVKVFVSEKEVLCTMMVFDKKYPKETLMEKTTEALSSLDRWCVPKQYYVVSEIPKNEMRKYDLKRINQSLYLQTIQSLEEWTH